MSAAFIVLPYGAAIVRGAVGRARRAAEPNGINIALSGRLALPYARPRAGFAALRGDGFGQDARLAWTGWVAASVAIGLTDRKAFKQTQ